MRVIGIFLYFACVLLSGCSWVSIVLPVSTTSINQALHGKPSCDDIDDGWNNTGKVVVTVSLSGGGKRAAAFAYGVMLGLQDFKVTVQGQNSNLLEQVDVITAVSGGAVPAAYYALNKHKLRAEADWQDFEKFLYEDTEWRLFRHSMGPANWFSPLTSVAAKYFGSRLYEDKTFADLKHSEVVPVNKAPYLVIGATDLSRAKPFTFTETQFNCIGSDLSKFPIGHAVAASAAFPIVFGNLILKNHMFGREGELGDWAKLKDRLKGKFVPLADGGLVDNLAIRVYRNQLNNGKLLGDQPESGRELARALIFVRVDGSAHVAPQYDESPTSPLVTARLQRSFDAVFEQQIEDVNRQLRLDVQRLNTLIEKNGFHYFRLRPNLDDAEQRCSEEAKLESNQDAEHCKLTTIPTRWSLSKIQIKSLIDQGRKTVAMNLNNQEVEAVFGTGDHEP